MSDRTSTEYIVVHCSATHPGMDIGRDEIDRWHKDRGWSGIGYHYVIRRDGILESGRRIGAKGAHARGYNHKSVGVCMVGGVDRYNDPQDNFTDRQWNQLRTTLSELRAAFPDAKIIGHNEISAKACPSFDVQVWLRIEGFI